MTELNTLIYGGEPLTEDTGVRYTEIRELLTSTVCEVTFTKVDGSERVMRCTLNPELLPPQKPLTETVVRSVNYDTLAVWDLTTGGWRSFRVANVRLVRTLS